MTPLKATLSFKKIRNFSEIKGENTLVLGFSKSEKGSQPTPGLKASKELANAIEQISANSNFNGALASSIIYLDAASLAPQYKNLVAQGVGSSKEHHAQNLLHLGAKLGQDLRNAKLYKADVFLDSYFPSGSELPKDFAGRVLPFAKISKEESLEMLATGIILGLYKFDKYRSKKTEENLLEIRLISKALDDKKAKLVLSKAIAFAESVYVARDLKNTAPNEQRPQDLATQAAELGKKAGYKTEVWDEKTLKAEGMNGILAVGRGSKAPPRLIIMQHNLSKKNVPTLVLVGKGITFDTGGISLKPGAGMHLMKYDMGGSAAVIAAMYGIAKLKSPFRVIGIVAAAENMPDGDSTRPGDVYVGKGGKTVEVLNTDAEGRLVLADALVHAATYKPDAVVDVATLTGAVCIALGGACTGVMGNNGDLLAAYRKASDRVGERSWELPLYDCYTDDMKSQVADIANIGASRDAGSQKGGAFLNFFVDGAYPWLHVDMAGVMDATKDQGAHCPGGPSGLPTRALIEFGTQFDQYFKVKKKK